VPPRLIVGNQGGRASLPLWWVSSRAWPVCRRAEAALNAINDYKTTSSVIRFELRQSSLGINFPVTVLKLIDMSNPAKDSPSANDLLKNSSLYREFQAEREEILRHKWIESEKAGRDIGFEQALTDWIIKHRANWRKNRQSAISG
jgi:hypothetical protein